MQIDKYIKNSILLVSAITLVGCGVEVRSDSDQTEVVIEHRDTVQYQIDRVDDYGYIEDGVASGCIYLEPGEEQSVFIEDNEVYADYEFRYRVRGDHLVVGIEEDGISLHRSYHRTELFGDGYTVEQNVVTGLGVTYLMTLEDTGCF